MSPKSAIVQASKMYFCGHIFGRASICPKSHLPAKLEKSVLATRTSKRKTAHGVPITPTKNHKNELRHPQHRWQDTFG